MSTPSVHDTFINEASDLLEAIESAALALEDAPEDSESVNLLFRAFHTLKGSAAMVGFDSIASFTHHVESALDQVRAGTLAVDRALITAVLEARDYVQHLLDGTPADARRAEAIIASLARLGGAPAAPRAAAPASPAIQTTYLVSFGWDPAVSSSELERLIETLRRLGSLSCVPTRDAASPLGPAYAITLTSAADAPAILEVLATLPAVREPSVERGLTEFLSEPPPAAAPATEPSLPSSTRTAVRKEDVVRVPAAKLDQLVKLVGELVISQSRLSQACFEIADAELAMPAEAVDRLIAELRDVVFGMRLMPIGPTFARFKRLARDLSAQLGKQIELQTAGDETELDKTVLDQLGDPLVHMIRNSMDHGIELPADRIAKGKPAAGRVLLTAAHDAGHVVITVQDDGRGLDRAAIRAKAEAQGLIEPGAYLSEQDTYDLITKPGFSTAQAVTQLSGRGVGMDVVKRTIEALRGTLSISSAPGGGTMMRLTLPLTLAIIDGLLVEIAGDRFIIPMASVTENLELTRQQRSLDNGRPTVDVRGELVPYIRLRELFAIRHDEPELERVVLVRHDGQRIGVVVDRVIGIHQTVIRSLGPFYRKIQMFSGMTILGDGRVAMILEIAGVVREASRSADLHMPALAQLSN